jgi:hypothetical protein
VWPYRVWRFLRLPFHRRTTPEFIEEIVQEDDVVLRLLRLRPSASISAPKRFPSGARSTFFRVLTVFVTCFSDHSRGFRAEGIALSSLNAD